MNLEIVGRHVLLFDDDATAGGVNSGNSLVPWAADPSLAIDRFDARHLLDRVPLRRSAGGAVSVAGSGDVSEAELDSERYCDLPPDGGSAGDGQGGAPISAEGLREATIIGQGGYNAIGFSYGGSNGSPELKTSYSYYRPSFPVPESLQNNMPPSEKVHQIIARTALFVCEHGGQSEIVLRVKQGDNPTFGFLMPDHSLHPYFRYLVDHPEVLKTITDSSGTTNALRAGGNEVAVAVGGALSLLGSVYGSGDDDENVIPVRRSPTKDPKTINFDGDRSVKKAKESEVHVDKDKSAHVSVKFSADEKSLSKKANLISSSSIHVLPDAKIKDGKPVFPLNLGKPQQSKSSKPDIEEVILEPPTFLKRIMEKIVEFIIRNGKEFEAILIEQDKSIGRFPFLLPYNQYYKFYSKMLQEAQESKLHGKRSSDHKYDDRCSGEYKKRERLGGSRDSSTPKRSCSEESSDRSLKDSLRKEKFKMVMGGTKTEPNQQITMPHRAVGVSADEAAAIVLAATRGVSPANVPPAIKRKAPGSINARNVVEAGSSVTDIGQRSNGVSSTVDDAWIAETIAKAAAVAGSKEADSSEASMTREQKLKAERLRRAKMFAEMLKSSGSQKAELGTEAKTSDRKEGTSAADLANSRTDLDAVATEREGRTPPSNKEASHRRDQDADADPGRERLYHRKHRSMESEGEEDDSMRSHKQWSKKHRSEYLRSHTDGDYWHRSRRYSSQDAEAQHFQKYHGSSDDERVHIDKSVARYPYDDYEYELDDGYERRSHGHTRYRHNDYEHGLGDGYEGRVHKHTRRLHDDEHELVDGYEGRAHGRTRHLHDDYEHDEMDDGYEGRAHRIPRHRRGDYEHELDDVYRGRTHRHTGIRYDYYEHELDEGYERRVHRFTSHQGADYERESEDGGVSRSERHRKEEHLSSSKRKRNAEADEIRPSAGRSEVREESSEVPDELRAKIRAMLREMM